MNYQIKLTHEQWKAIDETATENVNRFAGWLADSYGNDDSNNAWLASVKERYELWKTIQQTLIDSQVS